jgi:ABC-type sugar transport system ATPase subunit
LVLKPKSTPVKWTVKTLVARVREALCALPDTRKGGNNQRYTMGDAGMSAFSVFFMQSPSFLDFQVRMQKARGRNNASSLFGIEQIQGKRGHRKNGDRPRFPRFTESRSC